MPREPVDRAIARKASEESAGDPRESPGASPLPLSSFPLARRQALFLLGAAGLGIGSVGLLGASSAQPNPHHARFTRLHYGPHFRQNGAFYLSGGAQRVPVVVMFHGGAWREPSDSGVTGRLSADLLARGVAVWNINYRSIGSGGGGRITLGDCAIATDFLTKISAMHPHRLDMERVVLAGHSAGGQLAAWTANRTRCAVHPVALVSMAGPLDLTWSATHGSDRAARRFLGGTPWQRPDDYAFADPSHSINPRVRVTALAGTADHVVAPESSERYVRAARQRGATADFLAIPGGRHNDFLHLHSASWQAARQAILRSVGLT